MDHYAVMGNPIQHSLSPHIHSLFATQTRQNMNYQAILVDLDGLSGALNDFQNRGGRGLNITLPFKQEAFLLMHTLSARALEAKAVNTIQFNPDGSRFGDNTDGVGFIRDVTIQHQFSLNNKRILILGAGGAVRGVLGAILKEKPALLMIANRTENNAKALAHEFASDLIQTVSLKNLSNYQFDMVINGTSASLQDDTLSLPNHILSDSAFCYDMVYGKGMTPFLSWATEQGALIQSDGLGMLVEQAAESFLLWRGVKPETDSIINILKQKLTMNA